MGSLSLHWLLSPGSPGTCSKGNDWIRPPSWPGTTKIGRALVAHGGLPLPRADPTPPCNPPPAADPTCRAPASSSSAPPSLGSVSTFLPLLCLLAMTWIPERKVYERRQRKHPWLWLCPGVHGTSPTRWIQGRPCAPPSLLSGEACDEHLCHRFNSSPVTSSFGLMPFNKVASHLCSPSTIAVQLDDMHDVVQCWWTCRLFLLAFAVCFIAACSCSLVAAEVPLDEVRLDERGGRHLPPVDKHGW